ncbi:MAG TPA: PilZ domain-containing protein [Terriglobales bacterium]|nr:PilZ domain-containing protein [Terriglobales bacterium]
MMFHALLVSKDDDATAVLNTVLASLGIATVACSYPEAICQLTEQKFDAVIVDFDDPHSAALVLQNVPQSSSGNHAVTSALLGDKTKLRHTLGQGAHFVLYKPFTLLQAETGLRAAIALIKRERRTSCRVPLQLPIQLKLQDAPDMEGILLDLSETGMDVLAAQPLCPSALIGARFTLPDGKTVLEVRGEITRANPNGESGVRFVNLSDNARATLKAWIAANAPELPPPDIDPVTQCKLTDLSLGGCYVETESPFPEHAAIEICLKAEDVEVRLEGTVKVMHPGFGMGVEFASRNAEDRAAVERFIGLLAGQPGRFPALSIMPLALRSDNHGAGSDTDELEDPLLDLLRRGETLSQEEFLQELHRQRSAEVTPA